MEIRTKKQKADSFTLGTLYCIEKSREIITIEEHDDANDVFITAIELTSDQQAFYAKEYTSPLVERDGASKLDIALILRDERRKQIDCYLMDMKRGLFCIKSDASDEENLNLLTNLITKYRKQIHDGILYHESMYVFLKERFPNLQYHLGLVTRDFDTSRAENLITSLNKTYNESFLNPLIQLQAEQRLVICRKRVEVLQKFVERKLDLFHKDYSFQVYQLQKSGDDFSLKVNFSIE